VRPGSPLVAFYHVLVAERAHPGALRCILYDLDESSLRKRFVKPFTANEDMLIDGRIHRVAEIATVKIRRTEQNADVELKRIQEESWEAVQRFNRESSGVVLVSAGSGYSKNDLDEAGTDVTNEFLASAPSGGSSLWDHYGKEIVIGVIVTVVGGILLAIFL